MQNMNSFRQPSLLLMGYLQDLLKDEDFKDKNLIYLNKVNLKIKEALTWDSKTEQKGPGWKECFDSLSEAVISLVSHNKYKCAEYLLVKDPVFFSDFFKENFSKNEKCFTYLIAKNSIETLDVLSKKAGFKFNFEHLKTAVENQAETSAVKKLNSMKHNNLN